MSNKHKVITELFEICEKRKKYSFDNNLVKKISQKYKFGNPFDVTKIDNKEKLPQILLENDYAIMHLGNGNHRFIKGINKVYHDFEPISDFVEWDYRKSILNEFNSSESNILSVANNQRILHHFLFGDDFEFDIADITKRPKTYFPHRTKTKLEYSFGDDINIELDSIQIEIDLTIEFNGTVAVFEGKNGTPDSFAVYQIYHPFLYYTNANENSYINGKINKIVSVYVVKTIEYDVTNLKLWAYSFGNPKDITSIKLIKNRCYQLIK